MKNLPLGIQDFRELREKDLLYIDKTEIIHNLLVSKYYFLSRPRRFGKSLLISTLHELFTGNKALFKGLWIEDKIEWQSYPVIRIDFSAIDYKGNGFWSAIQKYLRNIAESYQIQLESESPKDLLGELIISLHTKYQAQVVLLIDEYDKPIIDFLEDLDKAREHRDFLKNLYSIIKPMDSYLRFVFLTGVSKFSKVSIFSDLNNLTDISTSAEFANITGYTQAELEHYFANRIEEMAVFMNLEKEALLQKIKTFYNGYSWNGKDFLYNPFSVLSFFRIKSFDNFWFSTGTPTFLTKLLQKDFVYNLSKVKSNQLALDSVNLENPNLTALLFQTGYLTIKEQLPHRMLRLEYPIQK